MWETGFEPAKALSHMVLSLVNSFNEFHTHLTTLVLPLVNIKE